MCGAAAHERNVDLTADESPALVGATEAVSQLADVLRHLGGNRQAAVALPPVVAVVDHVADAFGLVITQNAHRDIRAHVPRDSTSDALTANEPLADLVAAVE